MKRRKKVMSEGKVLVVDDEYAIRDMLRMALEISNFDCFEAEDTHQAYRLVVDEKPDLILLDWMLPGGSGIEFLRRLKRSEISSKIPVIMLTAKVAEDNVIQGLNVGADDYVTKPFAPRELMARVNALLRRSKGVSQQEPLLAGDLKLDPVSHRVTVEGAVLELGPTEFRLLHFFMSNPERAYSRTQVLDNVWGANVYVEERTVDVHIRRLRKVLASAAVDCSHYVQTVRGIGYRFSHRESGE
jgi:two-component system phosphate regulon response regulator PhoB